LLSDNNENKLLEPETRVYINQLYHDFTDNYPDYAARSKMTVSRQKFFKWVVAYALFKEGVQPETNRDMNGKWIIIKKKSEDVF